MQKKPKCCSILNIIEFNRIIVLSIKIINLKINLHIKIIFYFFLIIYITIVISNLFDKVF